MSEGRVSKFLTEAKRRSQYISVGRPKARLVGRSIHHIEPWSVFKISLLMNLSIWVIAMIASAILWGIASITNLIGRLENFVTEVLALESYNLPFVGTFFLFAVLSLAGAFIVTALTVLMCIIFNQISAIFGGIRMLVLEEESLQLPTATPEAISSQKIKNLPASENLPIGKEVNDI